MSLNWRPAPSIPCSIPTSDPFTNSLYEFLKYLEANDPITRRNLHVVGGHLTIGIGFDLFAGGPAVVRAVFLRLGLDYDYPENHTNAQPGSPEAIERDYIISLRSAVQGNNAAAVNNIMLNRYNDSRLNSLIPQSQRRRSFSFINDNEVKAVFDDLWPSVYRKNIEDRWPSLKNDATFKTSSEMMALASMTWNGGIGILGPKLKAAIDSGNRAEAWFEIRYNSNGGSDLGMRPGLATRRYFESQIFGLYNTAISSDDAKEVYRMFQSHRSDIYDYEKLYGTDPNSSNPEVASKRIADANTNYHLTGDNQVQTLVTSLNRAKLILLADLRVTNPEIDAYLSDNSFVSTNIYLNPHKPTDTNQFYVLDSFLYETGVYKDNGANDLMIGMDQEDVMYGHKGNDVLIGKGGNDYLFGDEGNDVLYAGDGNDYLVGGTENDVLYGGAGNDFFFGGKGKDTMYGGADDDTYFIDPGDGNDTIEDKEGENTVILCGKELKFYYDTGDGNTYISPDGWQTLEKSTGKLTDALNGIVVTLNQNFEEGDFGTTLITLPGDNVLCYTSPIRLCEGKQSHEIAASSRQSGTPRNDCFDNIV